MVSSKADTEKLNKITKSSEIFHGQFLMKEEYSMYIWVIRGQIS